MALSQSSSRCPHDSADHRNISTSPTSEPSNQTCECESVRLGDFFSSEYDLSDLPCPEDINHGSLPEEISSQPSSLPPSSPSAAGADSERANLVFNITVQNNLVNKFCTRFLNYSIPTTTAPHVVTSTTQPYCAAIWPGLARQLRVHRLHHGAASIRNDDYLGNCRCPNQFPSYHATQRT